MDLESQASETAALRLPSLGVVSERRRASPVVRNFEPVRKNIRRYGRGIFKAPPQYPQPGSQFNSGPANPALPPKTVADRLVSQYISSIDATMPIVHWPTFTQEYTRLYVNGSLRVYPSVWIALFFAILACGTLQTRAAAADRAKSNAEGKGFFETAAQHLCTWSDDIGVDHAKSALLLSVFLFESNLKSAALVWLGCAVRIAQDIGLHVESETWPLAEIEGRRRLWWAIYAWDRYSLTAVVVFRSV